MIYTVLLEVGAVGKTATAAEIGDTVTVKLHDENGMPIEVIGALAEVLEADDC